MRCLEECLKDSPHVSAGAGATKRSRGRNFKFFLERSLIQERSARGGREERIEEYEESLSFLSITPSPHDLRAVNPSRFFSAAGRREPASAPNRALGPGRHGSFRAVRFPEARGNSRRPVLALLRAAELAPGRPQGALGAAVGDPGPRGRRSLPPGRVRGDVAYPQPRRGRPDGFGGSTGRSRRAGMRQRERAKRASRAMTAAGLEECATWRVYARHGGLTDAKAER